MSIHLRPGSPADTEACFGVFYRAVDDLCRRHGVAGFTGVSDSADPDAVWQPRRPLFDHLAATNRYFWVAEDEAQVLGYARAVERDSVLQLTEFFVDPQRQSAGIGRELLKRAMPADGYRRREVIATTDMRGLVRYMKAGISARCPLLHFSRVPRPVDPPADLTAEPLTTQPQTLAQLALIDRAVIGYARELDHRWLMTQRDGFLLCRNDKAVGYCYIGPCYDGPFALLPACQWDGPLAFAEGRAAANGWSFGFDAPLWNDGAVRYFLDGGFQIDNWHAYYMSDAAGGRLDRYLLTSPTFLL